MKQINQKQNQCDGSRNIQLFKLQVKVQDWKGLQLQKFQTETYQMRLKILLDDICKLLTLIKQFINENEQKDLLISQISQQKNLKANQQKIDYQNKSQKTQQVLTLLWIQNLVKQDQRMKLLNQNMNQKNRRINIYRKIMKLKHCKSIKQKQYQQKKKKHMIVIHKIIESNIFGKINNGRRTIHQIADSKQKIVELD
ncbi:unnamed protein product [Paramecium sonneborni]|uniref:Uncharacterized protein n=1 Tax=Paramecium sonneborni TaxID=65129 RepID=A0A8S1JY39_9CILI|nr:unnamed protein product [Paramecium sonneborni]